MTRPEKGTPVRVAVGPMIGDPPTPAWIALAQMQVDPAYQRTIDSYQSRKIIAGMIREWNWNLCQPLVVTRRADNSLWVLDGQHRLEGARQRGDIPHLPAIVLSGITHAAEAETFVALNTERQRLGQGDIFAAMLVAGDPSARTVADLLAETGWQVARHSNTLRYKPAELACAPMLVTMVKRHGTAVARFALSTLRAAYPDAPVRNAATMLSALATIFTDLDLAHVSMPRLIAILGGDTPDKWAVRGLIYKRANDNLSRTAALARAIHAEAVDGDEGHITPVVVAPSPPTTFIAKPTPAQISHRPAPERGAGLWASDEKRWCTQCERRVARDKAAACGDRFCKLRAST